MGGIMKFGYRKMGYTKAEWAKKNAVHVATAGGKFGHRKLEGTVIPVVEPADEMIPPPPADRIDQVPVPAALAVIESRPIPLAELLLLECARKPGPRKTILRAIQTAAEAEKDSVVEDLAKQELTNIAAAEDAAAKAEQEEGE